MIATVRSEWIKLRTVLVHWVLVVIAVAFPLVVTGLTAALGEWSDTASLSRDISGLVVGLAIVTVMLLGAMTATSLTGEYSHQTIRPTFAATPSRTRVHGAKLVVVTAAVVAVVAVAAFGGWFLGDLILSARDASISITADEVLARLTSVIALGAVVAWFGYGLGLLIRNAPATITILLLWPLIIENLVGGLLTAVGWNGATRWLPYQAGIAATVGEGGTDALGRPLGLVYFGAVALALVGLGLFAEQRRDA